MAVNDEAIAATSPPAGPDLDAIDLIASKWAVPVLRALADHPVRRKQLKQALVGINDDRLDAALSRHLRWGLVVRAWIAGPRTDEPGYELTALGMSLLRSVDSLAAWQQRHEAELIENHRSWEQAHPAVDR
ncbi:MAG: winged helix-turn-helix transcriptional regulator [Microthrixaceae bacterium]|jgi:DNA-binding HxlR family transcriptional regulator|nr:winged helix-turn-helix transcriptional regulator [Microthrixaceae bacterium]